MNPDRQLMRLPFDQYQRYRSVREVAARFGKGASLKVLDVGGWPGLIHDFMSEHETYVVDAQETDIRSYIRADGAKLPFKDGSFDMVACLDVLEHVNPEKRALFVAELCRVAKGCVIMTAPFDSEYVRMAEQLLYDYVSRVFGEFPTLKEHLKYGLPDLAETQGLFDEVGYVFKAYPSGNVFNWLIMMFLKHYVMAVLDEKNIQEQIDELYNLNFSKNDFAEPCYRHILIAVKQDDAAIFAHTDQVFRPSEAESPLGLTQRLQMFSMLVDLLDLQVANKFMYLESELSRRSSELHQNQEAMRNLESILAERDAELDFARKKIGLDAQHIENLEQFMKKIKDTLIYRMYQRFSR